MLIFLIEYKWIKYQKTKFLLCLGYTNNKFLSVSKIAGSPFAHERETICWHVDTLLTWNEKEKETIRTQNAWYECHLPFSAPSVSHSAERNLQRPHGLFIWIANETQIHFKLNSVFFLFSNPLLLDSLNYSFSLELAKVLKLKNLRGKLETIFAVILSLPPFQLWHQHYLLPGLLQ